MNSNHQKKEIRSKMIQLRSEIPAEAKKLWDNNINATLIKVAKNAKYIHTYLPMGDEINLYPFIEDCLDKGKVIICPKSLPKGILKNLVLASLDELEDGVFGTQYPSGDDVFTGQYDLIIVPGLAFDKDGYRVGYGGGYYDRFLADQKGAHKIAACYPFQYVEEVPREPFDIAVDKVIKFGD